MLALSDATIGLIGVCVTASASIAAAWLAHRVRRENATQHGTSQELLSTLADKVDGHGRKLDQVAERVEGVAARVDHAHTRIDSHQTQPRRRWWQ